MTTFFYHYIDGNGRRRLHWQRAESQQACYALLAGAGIYPLHMLGFALPGLAAERGPNRRELALILRQLSVALASGAPLLEALKHMCAEKTNERQRAFLARLERSVLAGRAFSEALAKEKSVAPLLSKWIAIGERQGRLAQVLEEVYAHLERQERLRKRMQQELLYPLIVLAAVVLLGAVLSFVVMPILARQFMGFSAEVPLFMRFFLLVHDACIEYGAILCLIFAGAVFCLFCLSRTDGVYAGGRTLLRKLVLRLPLLRDYFVLRVYVPFARLFGQLLCSGVSASEALRELDGYFARSLFAPEITAINSAMARGEQLSQVIAKASFVPELARMMLLNGERYGRLPQALEDSASYYETVLIEKITLWLRFVEPLAVVLLGLLVLFMALGLFVPVLESYRSLLAQ